MKRNLGESRFGQLGAPYLPALLLCAVLVMAYLWRILFLGEVPLVSTVHNITDPAAGLLAYAPGWEVLKRTLRTGSSLLWTPARNAGTPPLYEEISGAFLHPWSWFCCLFDFGNSWRVSALGLMFLLAIAHVAIGRRILRLSWLGTACFVQLAVFNFFVMRDINHVYLLVYTGAAWTWYFLLESFQSIEMRRAGFWPAIFIGESLSIAWGASGGFPEAIFPAVLLGVLLTSFAWFHVPRGIWKKAIATLIGASFVGLGLSSFGLFSFTEGYLLLKAQFPHFRQGYGAADQIPLAQLPRLLVNLEVEGDNIVYYTVGCLPFILFVLGFGSELKKRTSRAVRGTLVAAALFFLVNVSHVFPALSRLYGSIPLLGMALFYAYFPPLLSGTVAWLAAVGLDTLYAGAESDHDRFAVKRRFLGGGTLLAIVVILYLFLPHGRLIARDYLPLLPILLAIFPFRRLLAKWSADRRERLPWVISLLILILLENCFFMKAFKYAPARASEEAEFGIRDNRIVDTICKRPDVMNYRWLWSDKIPKNFCVNHPDSPASATMLIRNHLLKNALFPRVLTLESPRFPYSLAVMSIRWYGSSKEDRERLDRWKVPYHVLYPLSPGWDLLDVQNVLPRAFLTRSCQWVNNRDEAVSIFEKDTYRLGSVVLEKDLSKSIGWEAACVPNSSVPSITPVAILSDTGSTTRLASIRGPGVLVLNDSYYPGWHAVDENGNGLPIVPGNLAFRAISLEQAKDYRITFRYRPWWLPWAWLFWTCSFVLLLAAGGIFLRTRTSKR